MHQIAIPTVFFVNDATWAGSVEAHQKMEKQHNGFVQEQSEIHILKELNAVLAKVAYLGQGSSVRSREYSLPPKSSI